MWRSDGKGHQDAAFIGSGLGLVGLAGREMGGSGLPARRPAMRVRPDAVRPDAVRPDAVRPDAVRPDAADEKDINERTVL
jgi:hypothetical protein